MAGQRETLASRGAENQTGRRWTPAFPRPWKARSGTGSGPLHSGGGPLRASRRGTGACRRSKLILAHVDLIEGVGRTRRASGFSRKRLAWMASR